MGGGLQKLITFFSGWAGLQKLITDLDMRNGYKGGVWRFSHLLQFIDFFHFFMI